MTWSDLQPLLDLIQVLVLFGVPGFSVLLLANARPRDAVTASVYTLGLSLVYLTIVSILLLYLGAFAAPSIILASLLPAVPVLIRWRRSLSGWRQFELAPLTAILAGLTAVAVLLVLLLTPHWNFLIATGMDAGNYEVYSNHFWTTGSFQLDARALLASGADPAWITPGNTWNLDLATGLAQPSYLPGYPVFLGILKATFATPVISYAGNVGLAVASLTLILLIAWDLGARNLTAVLLGTAVLFTPLFLYYSKQIMAEQLGLFATLLIAHSLLHGYLSRSQDNADLRYPILGLASGIALGMLSRLDFIPILMLIGPTLVLLEIDAGLGEAGWVRRRPVHLFLAIAVVSTVCAGIVAVLAHPAYLQHAQAGPLEDLSPAAAFVLLAAAASLLAVTPIVVAPILNRLLRIVPRDTVVRWVQQGAAITAGAWIAFVAWNLMVRPSGSSLGVDHDALNLLRLFEVSSLPLLGAALILSPWAIMRRAPHRALVVLFVVGFGAALYRSRHTPPDLWWMRRYLSYAVPLIVLTIGSFAGRLSAATSQRRVGRYIQIALPVILMVVVAFQVWTMRPMLGAQTNPDAPRQLAALIREVPDGALVVVVEGNSMVRGIANTYRSIENETVLVNVSTEALDEALDLASPDQDVVVLSPSPLEDSLTDDFGLIGPENHTVARQWVNWKDQMYEGTDTWKDFALYIYHSAPDG